MTAFTLTLILSQPRVDLDEADRLYARCNDATLSTSGGESRLDFTREADSLEAAIRSAVTDVEAAGFAVERVELERDALAVA